MQRSKYNPAIALGLRLIGLALCVIPPAVCTLSYFPLWVSVGYEYCIAGGVALLLALCLLPLFRALRERGGVSAYIIWLLLYLLFFSLSKIADQMTVICLVGFIGNLLGAICIYLSKRLRRNKE